MRYQYSVFLSATILLVTACTQSRAPTAADRVSDGGKSSTMEAVADQPVRHAAQDSPRPGVAQKQRKSAAPADLAFIRPAPASVGIDRENYAPVESQGIQLASQAPVSTFSIDVDTGSYANVRRMLQEGRLPPRDAVRVEELVNYFGYQDPGPAERTLPFRLTTELAVTPWNRETRLLRIALKAWEMPRAELPPSNLVFLIDVSGSMNSPDKLPLLKRSLKLLAGRMRAEDKITLVVYAGAAGVVLEPIAGNRQATIEAALENLSAGGSTHGSAGIELAYAKAREAFVTGGINRVILATDGDFNVGTVDQRALLDLIERERESGIALTTLGFGRGNLNDRLMEQLADHGNGNYAYIDTLLEAQKVLVEQVGGTLLTLARDVKVQVEFNPARVAEYRLIGYENRALRREDFNNDRVDAGELGAGHSVVALYELNLVGAGRSLFDPLRYGSAQAGGVQSHDDEIAYVKLRYKAPEGGQSRLLTRAVNGAAQSESLLASSDDFRFSAAVAAFAQRLRGSPYLNDFGYQDILALARNSRGADRHGYRSGFLRLVALAGSLDGGTQEVAMRRSDDGTR